jgi:hypothetical protein
MSIYTDVYICMEVCYALLTFWLPKRTTTGIYTPIYIPIYIDICRYIPMYIYVEVCYGSVDFLATQEYHNRHIYTDIFTDIDRYIQMYL